MQEPVLKLREIIWEVTSGKNRAERHRNTYPSLARDFSACCVKLADRIVNWSFNQIDNSNRGRNKFQMYSDEYEYFKEVLYSTTEESEIALGMWDILDRIYKEGHFCN